MTDADALGNDAVEQVLEARLAHRTPEQRAQVVAEALALLTPAERRRILDDVADVLDRVGNAHDAALLRLTDDEQERRHGGEQMTRLEVTLSGDETESLRRLAEELGTTLPEALRQLAAHGRPGWVWLLWLDLRHQLRTLLMQKMRRRGQRVGFKLPRQ